MSVQHTHMHVHMHKHAHTTLFIVGGISEFLCVSQVEDELRRLKALSLPPLTPSPLSSTLCAHCDSLRLTPQEEWDMVLHQKTSSFVSQLHTVLKRPLVLPSMICWLWL